MSLFEHLVKSDLQALIEKLKSGDPLAITPAVNFFVRESRGIWHGRARAKICRYLKNAPLAEEIKELLTTTVVRRLTTGNFSEQFKDQLSMAIRFRPEQLNDVAIGLLDSDKDYVKRYASWVTKTHLARTNTRNRFEE